MRTFIIMLVLVIMTGCASTKNIVVTEQNFIVVKPPTVLYNCPQLKINDFPHPDTATNQELSEFLVKIYGYNKTCGYNMAAIRNYIEAAEKRIQQG